jgi:DNA polymerase III subunit gamma/tau
VLSRCQRHEFRRLPLSETLAQLEKICKEENIKAEKPALELIARQSTGSLRDAISLLDQLASSGETLKLDWAQQVLGTSAGQAILDLIAAIVAKDSGAGLDSIHIALDAGADARQFARQMVDTLRGVLLVRMGATLGPEFAEEERQRISEFAKALTVPQLLRVLRLFNDAASEVKTAWQPGLPVEMAFIEAIQEPALEGSDLSAAVAPAPKIVNAQQTRSAPAAVPSKTSVTNSPPETNTGTAFTNQEWTQLKEKFKATNPNLLGLLNSVKMRELRGNVLFLGFAGDLLKQKMEKAENIDLLQGAISDVLGRILEVRCFLANKSGELPAGLDSSGMVAAAVRLGGEIVDKNDLGKRSE